MVAKLVSVLASLNQAGIRAKRGTLTGKAIRPETPVALVYPEKSATDILTLAVELFGTVAVECEDVAFEAVTVLNHLRAGCTVDKCCYSGKTGLFSVKVLASWPVALAQRVYLDEEQLENMTAFRAEAASEAYFLEDSSVSQSEWGWTLTWEELLPAGKTPEADFDGLHTVTVVTDGGTECYEGCYVSVSRIGDSRGTVQKKVMKCRARTVE